MIYRMYGTTGEKVSVIGFGAMRFKDVDDQDGCVEMILEAAKGGINTFDTAPTYLGGKSEIVLGKGFRELKRLGLPFYCSTKTFKADEKSIRTEIEAQLKRLDLESIDFYHVWCITTLEDWKGRKAKGIIKTFGKLKEEGLIRHICVSNHLIGDQIEVLLAEGVFEGVLFGYSAYNFEIRRPALEAITRKNLGCAIMNPLGGGIIPLHPGLFDFLKTRDSETVVEAAIRFLIAHERISVILVGFGNLEEVREGLRAAEGFRPLSAETLERIKSQASGAMEGICTGCRYCDHCPEGLPVPKLMEAYNYRLLYKDDGKVLDRLKWPWRRKRRRTAQNAGSARRAALNTWISSPGSSTSHR